MSTQLTVEYPESLPDFLQESPEEFEREAKLAMAVKLFERKRLSSGQAAALVDMERGAFLLTLHNYGVAMIDLSDNELASDVGNA